MNNTPETQEALQALSTGMAWIMGAYVLMMLGLTLNLILTAITAIHCAHKGPTEGKTAWTLCIIFLPCIGWITYWFISDRETDQSPYRNKGYAGKTPIPPAPPPKTTRDVADEITAEISARRHERR